MYLTKVELPRGEKQLNGSKPHDGIQTLSLSSYGIFYDAQSAPFPFKVLVSSRPNSISEYCGFSLLRTCNSAM